MAWKASNILNHKFLFNIYLKKMVLLEKKICYIFINKNEELQKKRNVN
jgi:hypothetical protein